MSLTRPKSTIKEITVCGIYGVRLVRRGKGFQKYLVDDITTPGEVAILIDCLNAVMELDFYEMIVYYKNEFYVCLWDWPSSLKYYIISDSFSGIPSTIYITNRKAKIHKLKAVKAAIRKFLCTMRSK